MATMTSVKCRFQLHEVAPRKGFTPATLTAATGLHRTTVHRFWFKNPRRIKFSTLERICHILQVQPGELIALVPVDVSAPKDERP